MLNIVGGFYREICSEPYWDEFYGPGGRASAALSNRKSALQLFTYAHHSELKALQGLSQAFGFKVTSSPRQASVSFRYLHMLRKPAVSPLFFQTEKEKDIEVSGEVLLRYGFYEGDAKVFGKKVIYDPQNGPYSQPFDQNGSRAENLVIVCNYLEGQHLTSRSDPDQIVDELLNGSAVSAVVLKGAWSGAIVATKRSRKRIQAIPTAQVFKAGSGDIFTGEFAWGWGIEKLSPIEAAERACVQTAFYCENATVPLPIKAARPESALPSKSFFKSNRKFDVYLAAPFFTSGQLSVVEEVGENLKNAGLRVFSPYHEVGVGSPRKVCQWDLEGIRSSKFLFAILDDKDPGTLFEVGYARALKIPVLGYWRNPESHNVTMFEGSDCEIVRDFTTAIYRAYWYLNR